MKQYQHSKYAGGDADVIKHLVLSELLTSHPAINCYIESHAGAGCYQLPDSSEHSSDQGIDRVWEQLTQCYSDSAYLKLLKKLGYPEQKIYPGSPLIADSMPNIQHLTLFENNRGVAELLRGCLPDAELQQMDGFGCTPWVNPNSCLFIDPPYKAEIDYCNTARLAEQVATTPGVVVLVWFPLISISLTNGLIEQLARSFQQGRAVSFIRKQAVGAMKGFGLFCSEGEFLVKCSERSDKLLAPQLELTMGFH